MCRYLICILMVSGILCSPLQTASAAIVVYTYDDNQRLVKAQYSRNYLSYTFDKNNNILTRDASDNFSWLLFLPAIFTPNTASSQKAAGSSFILRTEQANITQ